MMTSSNYRYEVFTKDGFAFSIHYALDSAEKDAERIGGTIKPFTIRTKENNYGKLQER